jgi:hypothetical protein
MSRMSVLWCVVLLASGPASGCRLPETAVKPFPEGPSFTYQDLLLRARTQATTAVEAFYVDGWGDIADAAAGLEQTARFLPRSAEIPDAFKEKLAAETDVLRQDALKLGEAARAKNARAVNDALQRINLRIRDLRPDDRIPPPAPPPKVNQ